jgi:hypothetical protein
MGGYSPTESSNCGYSPYFIKNTSDVLINKGALNIPGGVY